MTEEERKARKRAYHTEWQQKNRDKCQAYHQRHFEKKVERHLLDRAEQDGLIVSATKVEKHKALCLEANDLYARKNADYGDSFHTSFKEEGMAMVRIRLGDKLNRFKTLSCGTEQQVKDESIRDTLMDLANYALMAVLEMEVASDDGK